ncbi:MAG: family 78 glycoside hydrolase catalytic domain [Pseudobutyrivibrio sp.]|nr:family 78 glycoside hydrolase catalytic domain [Pseudobutyrivibrio sp.]
MNITNLKINGITNPIGFDYKRVKCSWKVEHTTSKKQTKAKITVAADLTFNNIIGSIEDEKLSSIGSLIDVELEPYTRYYYTVEVWGDDGDYGKSDVAFFETGKMEEQWTADYIGTQSGDEFHPVFVKGFSRPEGTSKARIYITGLGLYEAYINGKKIGEEYLAPFINDYRARVQYQTYDITELLHDENEIRIYVGNGFYKGRIGYEGHVAFFGDKFGTIAEIHMWDEAGNDHIVNTDSTWQYQGSDVIESDIYDGEVLDRTFWKERANDLKVVQALNFDKSKLVPRYSLPVKVKETLSVKEIIKTPAGETVLDFGQNFAGYVSFQAGAENGFKAGTKVVLDFGEILQDDNFYNDNYRTAKAQFTYVSDGRDEEVRPHFTYYGFRYVRVTGWPQELKPEDFTGNVVYSDLDNTVTFDSSNEKLNRLFQNCLWGQKSNFIDMPTDCPQRDERLGWTGDAQVFAQTASFNMDTRAFYRKFLSDLRVEQLKNNGAIPNYIPNNSPMIGGSSVWGDAATFIPMALYDYFGDRDELAELYPMMKDWVEFIIRGDKEHGDNHLWNFGFHFGDWLAQDGVTAQSMKGGTDDQYVASVYYYASVEKLARAAEIIGKQSEADEYQTLAEKIREAILNEFFSNSGRLCIDTQTGYLISLKFGIYRDKEKLIDGLKTRLKKDCFKIKGGFVGAPIMCQTLAENGLSDVAYYILFQEGFPGWMHCINLGATTIWERWNSVLDDGKISGTDMNSLNHYSYGSVMEYVYRNICGINQLLPGFRRVKFAPNLNSKLKSAALSYDSASGKYVSRWSINDDGTVTVHFEVPFNCTAVAVLPGTDGKQIELTAGVYQETYKPNVDYTKRYSFASRLEEMKDDSEAVEILGQDLPLLAGLIAGGDPETLSMSLEELQFMFFFGLNPQMVQDGTKRLLELKA